MKNFISRIVGVCALTCPMWCEAQLLTDFESITAPAANGSVLFRTPNISGTTSPKLQPAPSTLISQVSNVGVPIGAPAGGTNSLLASWNFVDTGAAPLWLRLTTLNTTTLGNPTIGIATNTAIQFDIWTDHPLFASVLVRETETAANFGASGGSVGTIEYVGGNPSATTGNRGVAVPANTWTTLTFDLGNSNATPVFAFTGNGILEPGADGKGVIEALGLAFDDVLANRNSDVVVWVDNIQVVPVPEPGTLSLIALGIGGFFLHRRFRRR